MEGTVQMIQEPTDGKMELVIEQRLETLGNQAVLYAKSVSITNNEQYEEAAGYLKEIKSRVKAVKEYWAEPKARAKAAHQSVVDREKAMLEPLNSAEGIIKRTMVVFQNAVAEAQRRAEAEARKRQQEEAERMMQEAIKAEEQGNEAEAHIAMAMAEMVEDMKTPIPNAIEKPKAAGISTRKVWKARVVDASLVPVNVNGVEIRPISLPALDKLAGMTRGSVQIPGVEVYEETIIAARA